MTEKKWKMGFLGYILCCGEEDGWMDGWMDGWKEGNKIT